MGLFAIQRFRLRRKRSAVARPPRNCRLRGAAPHPDSGDFLEKSPLKTLQKLLKKIQAVFAFEKPGFGGGQQGFRLWWKPVALYRAVAWLRLHNCKISAGVGNLAQTQRSGVPQTKSCGLPAKRGGSRAETDSTRFRRSGSYRSKEARRLLQECVQNEFRWQIPKENAVFGPAQARFPTDIAQGTRRGRRAGRRTSRPQKTFCGAEAAFCLRASTSLLLGGQGTSRKFPPAAEILRSNAAIATQLLRPLRTRCIIPYCAGKTHTGRLPPAAAQTPSRGWAQPARERVRRDGRRGRKPSAARKSRHFPAFRCLSPYPHPQETRNPTKKGVERTWASASASSAALRS